MNTYNFDAKKVKNDLVAWIRDWFDKNGNGCNAVIGISGGKDSTVVAALCVEALGKDRVIGIMMPNGVQKDISDSQEVCHVLGIKNFTVNIAPMVDAELKTMELNGVEISDQTRTNIPPRIRMTTLYAYSQSMNGRVSNNCNLSEDIMGYSTRWGDAAGDFSPLSKLTTVEIIQIGEELGLPEHLVHKTPIDGLNVNPDGSYVTDEQKMGVSYADIHLYARQPEKISMELYKKIFAREKQNEFKLHMFQHFDPEL